MTDLKDLSIFQLSRKNMSIQHKNQNNQTINQHRRQLSHNKYRLSIGNPKTYNNLNKVRLSHKAILDQTNNGLNRLKRRISTAGTSKRFPKDFFKMESEEEKQSKTPLFCFKMKKNVFEEMMKKKLEEKKLVLKEKRKDLENDISYQNTPKFNDPKQNSKEREKEDINEFLILQDAPNYVTPFLSVDEFTKKQKDKGNFKKVKKGCNQKQKRQEKKQKSVDHCFRVRRVVGSKE